MKDTTVYRLTIEDLDPTWSEWHLNRLPDVHGMPAGTGHFWTDRNGHAVDGFEAGGSCGGCGWRPDEDAGTRHVPPSRSRTSRRGTLRRDAEPADRLRPRRDDR